MRITINVVVLLMVILCPGCDCFTTVVAPFGPNFTPVITPLTPHLEHCCCSVQDVYTYHQEVLQVLNRIVTRPYFRYFRANLNRQCPFWAVSLLCMGKDGQTPCAVSKCQADELPAFVWSDCEMTIPPRDPKDVALNLTTQLSRKAIPWGLDDAKTGSWSADADRWGEHVDLILNPESNTYYLGEMANRIWRAIYDENCFKAATESEMCTEERLFYRLMSGLHASISVHLSANYYVNPHSVPPTYNWNLDEFQRRVGAHPDRIRNLYVTYLFVVRSVAKVKHLILSGNYNSGDLIEDAHLRREIQALLNSRLLCIDTFNESDVVQSDHSAEYVNQMHEKLLNITRLTDCLTCEKCRLWGKVQMLGLGTALRIVLSKEPIKSLQRGEVVTLINLLRQLSYSIARVGEMSTAFSSRQDIHSEKSDNL